MEISREELEQRMRRAAELRRTLRRATRTLQAFGAALLDARQAKVDGSAEPR